MPLPKADKSMSGVLRIGIGFMWLLLAVALLVYHFSDTAKIEITWETATEQGTVGFNVYRSSDPDNEYILINKDQFIDSKGGPVSGAQYSFVDQNVEAGKTYYYLLEEIESDGRQNRYTDEIMQYPVPDNTWWAVGLAVFSALFGLVIFGLDLKEKRKR
jgi:hypothetical protein